MLKRRCNICKDNFDLNSDSFHKDSSRTHGFMYNCKQCEKQRTRDKYLKNPRLGRYKDMTAEQKRNKLILAIKYRKTPKGKSIGYLKAYKSIDGKKGRTCDLDQEYLIQSFIKPCVYCGYSSDGVDRLDNKKGHIKSNCVPCCKECNCARMDNFTYDEMLIIGQAIKLIKARRHTATPPPSSRPW